MHALQETRKLLNPNGLLVNIHDLPVNSVIELHYPHMVKKMGWLMDRENFANELSAFNALAQVVADRYFLLEDERNFGYNIFVDNLDELQEWFADWWTSAVIPDNILQQLTELNQDAQSSSRIVINLQSRMTKLRAN